MSRGVTDLNVNFPGNRGLVPGVFRHVFRSVAVFATDLPRNPARLCTNLHSHRQRQDADRVFSQPGLPAASATHQVLRRRTKQTSGLSDQQLRRVCTDHHPVLPLPLAGRVVLQMDLTACLDQAILRCHREYFQDTNRDSHRKKTASCRSSTLHNSTDSELGIFRGNTARLVSQTFRYANRCVR